MAVSAGRVLPIPKGAYDATAQYNMLDMVSYQGSMYICKQTCIGQTPADGAYWQLSASGASGSLVESFNGRTGTVVPAKNDYDIGQIKPLTGATQGQVPIVDANGDFVMGEPASSGHTIVNRYGIDMAKEDALQFKGADMVDDSTNGRTVITVSELITLNQAQYNALSQAEKEDLTKLYFISDAGGSDLNLGDLSDMNLGTPTDGDYPAYNSVSGKYELQHAHGLKEIWVNPNPTSNFGAQTITINNLDVAHIDAIEIEWATKATEQWGATPIRYEKSALVNNALSCDVLAPWVDGNLAKVQMSYRQFTLSLSGTTLTITLQDALLFTIATYGSSAPRETNNSYEIPVRILGLIHND